jgi:hypothetical protein
MDDELANIFPHQLHQMKKAAIVGRTRYRKAKQMMTASCYSGS